MVPASEREPRMSQALRDTQIRAFDLAKTLMVCVIVFKTGSGFGFMPASEYDGDMDLAVHEFDLFRR